MPSKKDKRKADRQKIFKKTDGRCAYCGKELKKLWHEDHVHPLYRGLTDLKLERMGVKRGVNNINNKLPACPRCNRWKGTMSVETFRKQIQAQHERMYRDVPGYRICFDMGRINHSEDPPIFYFESLGIEVANE